MKLYEMTREFVELKQQLEEYDLDPEILKDTLDSLKAPIEEKAENIIKYTRELEAEENALKEEAKRLNDRAASVTKKREWMKTYLDEQLKAAGIKELKAGIFKVSYRKGTEVVQVNEEQLPPQYWVPQDPKPMGKTELKKRLKDGENIPGVSLVRNPDSMQVK